MVKPLRLIAWSELEDRQPAGIEIKNLDVVAIRYADRVSVLYGRCLHRGALLADGHIAGNNLICGVHGWDYRFDSGVSEYNNAEALYKFRAWIEADTVWVDEQEIDDFLKQQPQPFQQIGRAHV